MIEKTKKIDKTTYVSYSRFSNFLSCPHRYMKMYIEGIKVFEDNEYSIFGTAMHSAVQRFNEKIYSNKLVENQINNNSIYLTKQIHKLIEEKKVSDKVKNALEDFNSNGIKILRDLYKKKDKYFPKNYTLIGNEIKLKVKLKNNVVLTGYIDTVLKDNDTDEYWLYDYKTSLWGWKKNKRNDDKTKWQLILYKIFYSAINNIPLNKINVAFVILKQNIYDKASFPQSRIAKIEVPSGNITINKCLDGFNDFLKCILDKDFIYKKTTDKNNCKYCGLLGEHCEGI